MFNTSNTHADISSSYWDRPNISDFGLDIGFTRMDGLPPITLISNGISSLGFVNRVDNEEGQENEEVEDDRVTKNDPVEEARPDGAETIMILESDPILIEPKEGGSDGQASHIA
ncbi:hypothetical protein GOBAR_AA26162 [Gossypium barbadense]|uniref:Uncharacterized protein n=1 Tax=Gossypium barbadense TaxID=3634 RepID=A0A2P5WTV0_GOSBA|nr:hypothetical protein GOBAR_AA26162 [Gossypium barbadense]